MTAVKISGTISKDSRPDNGLESIAHQLAKDEFATHVVVGVVDLKRISKEPGEAPVPTVRFLAIEPMDDDDRVTAMALLNAARKRRDLGNLQAGLFDRDPSDTPTFDEIAAQKRDDDR